MYGSGVDRVEQLRWALYVELLRDQAVYDLDAVGQRIADDAASLRARSEAARRALAQNQLSRASQKLRTARIHQRTVRQLLLLEEPDGQS